MIWSLKFGVWSLSFSLLSHLWLHEPDSDTISRASIELGLPVADPSTLALAYADLFLLNVYPYGTAFSDPSGELNGPAAQRLAALYEAHGYQPPELNLVGAPDHLGLCLGFLAHLAERDVDADLADTKVRSSFCADLLVWAPVCCLAAERNPSTHPFYRTLAACTREHLLAETSKSQTPRGRFAVSNLRSQVPTPELQNQQSTIHIQQSEDEVRLRDIVRFFLAPARCGVFLSRSRLGQLAKALGVRLPFGSRFEVAEMLFESAGESGQVAELLRALGAEVEQWAAAYRAWVAEYPAWQLIAVDWLERIDSARQTLTGMREILESPPELEYEEAQVND